MLKTVRIDAESADLSKRLKEAIQLIVLMETNKQTRLTILKSTLMCVSRRQKHTVRVQFWASLALLLSLQFPLLISFIYYEPYHNSVLCASHPYLVHNLFP